VTGDHVLAIDQLRCTVAAMEDEREREAAVATFFAVRGQRNRCIATRCSDWPTYLPDQPRPDDLELSQIPGTTSGT
jgi:hypothetical protein